MGLIDRLEGQNAKNVLDIILLEQDIIKIEEGMREKGCFKPIISPNKLKLLKQVMELYHMTLNMILDEVER